MTQVQSKDDFEKSSIVSELPSHDDPGELTFEEGAGKRCCCLYESFSMIDVAGGMGRHVGVFNPTMLMYVALYPH